MQEFTSLSSYNLDLAAEPKDMIGFNNIVIHWNLCNFINQYLPNKLN